MTLRLPSASQNCRKLPGSSGISTASSASRSPPRSARSATWRSRSKFMLAPLFTATRRLSCQRSRSTHFFSAGDRERAGGLDDRARVLEHVLDRGADLVGVDEQHLVDVLLRQS